MIDNHERFAKGAADPNDRLWLSAFYPWLTHVVGMVLHGKKSGYHTPYGRCRLYYYSIVEIDFRLRIEAMFFFLFLCSA